MFKSPEQKQAFIDRQNGSKTCTKCKQIKTLDNFFLRKSDDYYYPHCKKCHHNYWLLKHPLTPKIPKLEKDLKSQRKKCKTCKEVKPLTEFNFVERINRYHPHCHCCRKAKNKADHQKKQAKKLLLPPKPPTQEEIDALNGVKLCGKCGIKKNVGDFYPSKNGRSGVSSICKECDKTGARNRASKNKERRAITCKIWRENNKDKIKANRLKNNEKRKARLRERYRNDKQHREKIKQDVKKYRENPKNTEKLREKRRLALRIKRKEDPYFRLVNNLRRRMLFVLAGARKADCSRKLVGCTWQELRKHLESQFREGMSWDNYGMGKGRWVVDHRKPCKDFNLADPEQQRICFHYTNLQPLWYLENAAKDHPFKIKDD